MNRCPICTCEFRPVMGNGPTPCDILFIGERPGGDENRLGKPFIGKSGRELNENYLWLAGLHRDDIRITNSVKCYAEGNRKPSEKEIRECAGHFIPEEIEQCNPSIIVLLGASACSLVPGLDLDIAHGIPCVASVFGWEGIVVPMYHPAAGLHDTGKMIPLLEDFERLGQFLKGEWVGVEDQYPTPVYQLVDSWDVWDRFVLTKPFPHGYKGRKLLAVDTERHGENAFSVQFSAEPGTGYMLLWSQQVVNRLKGGSVDIWKEFRDWIRSMQENYDWEIVLHNAGQDLDWLDRMGVRVSRFRDTMQEAYHLGNLPQGLKALAYRLCGVKMRTYEDVVLPHSREAMANWLLDASAYADSNLRYVSQKQLKTKVKTISKPGEVGRGLSRIYRHTLESEKYDPWEKVEELFDKPELTDVEKGFVESTRAKGISAKVIEKLIGGPGPYPIVGIGNVPLAEAVRYGCADADMTLRVALKLQELRDQQMQGEWNIAEGDQDK